MAVGIGLTAGLLSGMFGIGGGLVTTPAIRLLLGRPDLIAVGTPLPVIIPTAVAGAIAYARRGSADVRAGFTMGLVGGAFAVIGAQLTTLVGGTVVLVVTGVVICWSAGEMLFLALCPRRSEVGVGGLAERDRRPIRLAALGVVAGLYSGFLGLGGGFIVVPALVRYFGFPAKRAVGTSLVVVGLLAVPGTIAHYALGNVDVGLAGLLAIGVVPGALLGARITAAAKEKTVRVGFALMLLAVGAFLALSELGVF